MLPDYVAPLAGAGIEIGLKTSEAISYAQVAPLAGAGIEIEAASTAL